MLGKAQISVKGLLVEIWASKANLKRYQTEMRNMLLETEGEEILVKKYRTGLNYVKCSVEVRTFE